MTMAAWLCLILLLLFVHDSSPMNALSDIVQVVESSTAHEKTQTLSTADMLPRSRLACSQAYLLYRPLNSAKYLILNPNNPTCDALANWHWCFHNARDHPPWHQLTTRIEWIGFSACASIVPNSMELHVQYDPMIKASLQGASLPLTSTLPTSQPPIFFYPSFHPPLSPSSILIMRHSTIVPGSWEGQYIRLELISANHLPVPSRRTPAGIYVSIDIDSKRHWKSPVRAPLTDDSDMLGYIVILSLREVSELSVEIRFSYELGRMLCSSGEVIGKLEISWDELLDHGDESLKLSFPSVCGYHPSITLKVTVLHPCDDHDGTPFDFVLDQCPVDHPDRAAALANLASARLIGYIQKDLQDIDSTISLFREALALRPQGHPDHTLSLYHLTEALTWRYSKEGTAIYIHECVQLYCKLLPLCPEGTYLHGIAAGANGVECVIRECNNLPTDASDEGIHLRRIVLQLCPLGHQHRPQVLHGLSWALCIRFRQCGGIDDIDESIRVGREAISLCPKEHTGRASYLNDLAYSLRFRFDHQGRSHDLDEAICLFEEALRMHPVGYESRHVSLSTLGGALRSRFIQGGDIDDIDRAISLRREALTLSPPEHPHHVITLNNLAIALKIRYNELDTSEDLDEAIDLYRESLRLRRLDHLERHRNLYNLSSTLSSRFTKTWKNEDIEEAIRLCQESLEALPSLHPDRSISHSWLRTALLFRYQVQRNPADLSLAVDNFRLASGHPTQGFPERINEAVNWARQAEVYQHESALEAYQICLELFDNHVMTRSSVISRREATTAFRGAQSLPVDAASCAIRRDNLRQAVELVEQGRGQQWSLASRLRTPLEDLESTDPNLAHKFSDCSKCLSEAQGSAVITDRSAADWAATEYRRLTRKWEAAVVEIRLQAAACQGPVIILIASQYSCSAIVVPTSREPHNVRFPRLALTDLKKLKDDFAKAIKQAGRMRPEEPRKDLARQAMKKHVPPSFVAIGQGQPGAGQGKALLAVDDELELVRKLVPTTANPITLSGDDATRVGALEALQQHTWVHLTCHGKQDHEQPYNSHFAMRDTPLTLLDIMEQDIPHTEFTFLSACHTAVGDEKTPDEVIHLAAGLQFSGFKSVIGTLWKVDDAVAKHIVKAFYEKMFEDLKDGGVMDCTKVAWALNHATYNVKKEAPLEQRIVFVHIDFDLELSFIPSVSML
ncbi:CHAT domain-containing protein [Suillus placidus]|uniref:CHAT domain-containing protein n=1 Tax=Suillus placidus TaxID=48579 RepID=A0A9P6ZRR9_9AGAM|nr:CHAT domain-containing protein [Suillus placidus]